MTKLTTQERITRKLAIASIQQDVDATRPLALANLIEGGTKEVIGMAGMATVATLEKVRDDLLASLLEPEPPAKA